ncbi:MAG: hypothetical protein R3C05_29185 [Pirellulaceae bacterium]
MHFVVRVTQHPHPLPIAIAIVLLSLLSQKWLLAQEVRLQAIQFHNRPSFPDPLGVAGPLVGGHDSFLIVAGGANFAAPNDPQLWSLPKRYLQHVWIARCTTDSIQWLADEPTWRLDQPIAYSAVASFADGVICLGGEDSEGATSRAFMLRVSLMNGMIHLIQDDHAVPDLPQASTSGCAVIHDSYLYVLPGQVTKADGSSEPSGVLWRLPLAAIGQQHRDASSGNDTLWETMVPPAEFLPRTHAMLTVQAGKVYVLGGRRFEPQSDTSDPANLKFFRDVWSFDPSAYEGRKRTSHSNRTASQLAWRQESLSPVPMSAGTALPISDQRIAVLSYADGSRIAQALRQGVAMEDFDHPGFPLQSWIYDTKQKSWTAFDLPVNQVTTPAIRHGERMFLISGEIRPRVRTTRCWEIRESNGLSDRESGGVRPTVRD